LVLIDNRDFLSKLALLTL